MINAVTDYHSEWPRHDIITFLNKTYTFTASLASINGTLMRCYTRRFATTIFNAPQRCNIVSNGYNIVPTLQLCVAIKIVVANRPV